jgi:DNA-binding XRE family transcriptional regulator
MTSYKQLDIEKRYGKPLREVLLDLHSTINTRAAMANELGITPQALNTWLNDCGLKDDVDPVRRRTDIESQYGQPLRVVLVEQFAALRTRRAMATELGVSPQTVATWIAECGLSDQIGIMPKVPSAKTMVSNRRQGIGGNRDFEMPTPDQLTESYSKYGKRALVANEFGVSEITVRNWIAGYGLTEKFNQIKRDMRVIDPDLGYEW